jgi:hypothetical protein
MEEAPKNGKESSHSAHVSGMNEWMNVIDNWPYNKSVYIKNFWISSGCILCQASVVSQQAVFFRKSIMFYYILFKIPAILCGSRGGTVGWGTAVWAGRSQVWFPMVSMEFFIDKIFLVTPWPWDWLSLTEMSTRNITWGVKATGD